MAFSIVQIVSATGSTYPLQQPPFPNPVTPGNKLLVVGGHSYSASPPSVASALGNTLAARGSQPNANDGGNNNYLEVFEGDVTVGGTETLTVNDGVGNPRHRYFFLEVTALPTGTAWEVEVAAICNANPCTATLTTLSAGDVLFGMFFGSASGTANGAQFTQGAGFTPALGVGTDFLEYQVVGAAGSYSATATSNGTNLTTYGVCAYAIAFKVAAPSGPTYTLTPTTGSVAVAGAAAPLAAARKASVTPGAFAVTGTAPPLSAARKVAVSPGAVSVTGTATGLVAGRKLPVATGAIAVGGTAVPMAVTRRIAPAAGIFSVSGVATPLRRAAIMATVSGAYGVTGTAATLSKGTIYTLPVATGSFALTGRAAPLAMRRVLAPTLGAVQLVGRGAGLVAARTLGITGGAYLITGHAATLSSGGGPAPTQCTRLYAGPAVRVTRVYAGPATRVTRLETFPS